MSDFLQTLTAPVATPAQFADTKERIRLAPPQPSAPVAPQGLAGHAVQQGWRALCMAQAELFNEALSAFLVPVFDTHNGKLINVAPRTYKLHPSLIAPWSSAHGAKRTRSPRPRPAIVAKPQRAILRAIMVERGNDGGLFFYVQEVRAWCLNRRAFPTLRGALYYMERNPITWHEYKHHHARYTHNQRVLAYQRSVREGGAV